jgi:hypothetical protein
MILATDSARVAEVTKMIHAAVIGCHLGVDHTVAKTTVTVRSYALSFEIP